jgi:DNA-binding NarL/FixJ family response regulator
VATNLSAKASVRDQAFLANRTLRAGLLGDILAALRHRTPTPDAPVINGLGFFDGGAGVEIRVLLVDDFPLVRGGIAAALESDGAIEVVGEAATAADGFEQALALEPDVVLLDLGLPDRSGIDVISRLSAALPRSRVIVVTASENVDLVASAMSAGAYGYLTKRASARELRDAVITVHGGGTVLDADLAAQVFRAYPKKGAGARPLLTERERQVIRMVGEGLTDREIAGALFLSPRTVQNQLTSVRRKTGLGRRSELAHWAATHFGA